MTMVKEHKNIHFTFNETSELENYCRLVYNQPI